MIKISREEYKLLATYIKEHYGIFLKEEKKDLLVGRLYRILEEKGFKNFTEYYKYLLNEKSGVAANLLIDRITTNHTYFMREASHFDFLMEQVLPYWKKRMVQKDLRIWCAACASGEEAYTLAILIDEFFGKEKIMWDTKVLATDLSRQVLEKAQMGYYKKEEVELLPIQWQKKYFTKFNEKMFVVQKHLKDEVIFRQFNLVSASYPFKRKFHIIFCRNVMIYFDEETRRQLLIKFHEVLEPGGYLFIGKSEAFGNHVEGFRYVCPSIYQKI